ncbi:MULTISPECIES: hypothetical protein [Streptomyces]|uniref:DUF1918 domain-containing protein n=1 Tax=Streptomyces argyrophylli TaxID=2726118 RepID=A0A6M4PIG9_9ACTN|nr:hypothetical protein [Streptomyces argyrophyllae]QJS10891.1 hypothetical protein HKX69_16445 [Streptomyces argyrophyllae]
MTRARAEVGDLVEDADGRHAIVTDIRQDTDWVLRPESGSPTIQWETDEPDTLHVIETRTERLSREKTT